MNLVDSCGWLEYFANGPNAKFFAPPIENPKNLLIPTICIFEVFKSILRQRGQEYAATAFEGMRKGRIIEMDTSIAVNAAILSIEIGLPLADSVILATARAYKATIWTQDADFKNIDGVKFITKAI